VVTQALSRIADFTRYFKGKRDTQFCSLCFVGNAYLHLRSRYRILHCVPPSLAYPQGWARDCVISDCCIRIEQDARISGFIERSCWDSGRKRFSARPSDGNINALRIVLHTIYTRGTMGTENVSLILSASGGVKQEGATYARISCRKT
jgi:hypothetical protein